MRKLLILALGAGLLFGCAGQKVFTSKGVSYLNQPVRELEACYKFTHPGGTNPEFPPMSLIGTPMQYNNRIYLPVESFESQRGGKPAYTTIYSMDNATGKIMDSLVVRSDANKQSYRHIVAQDNLYIVGMKDSLVHIIKVDATLKSLGEFDTNIKAVYLPYVAVYDNRLRLVAVDKAKTARMYELKFDTMQPERERQLAQDTGSYYIDRGNLWFFTASDSLFSTIVINLTKYDPIPVYKDFDLKIPMEYKFRTFNAVAADSMLYVSYNWFTDDTKGGSKLVAINYLDGKQGSRDYIGLVSFDITKSDGKTYIFRTDLVGKRQAYIVAELGPDLQESNRQVSFFLAEREFVKSIKPLTDGKFYLTGTYEQLTGRKYVEEIPGQPKIKMPEMIPQPFLAIYSIQ